MVLAADESEEDVFTWALATDPIKAIIIKKKIVFFIDSNTAYKGHSNYMQSSMNHQ